MNTISKEYTFNKSISSFEAANLLSKWIFLNKRQRSEGWLLYTCDSPFKNILPRNFFTVTLIANLLLMVMQKRIRRTWSFSNLATMFRIMLMYYVNCYTFFEEPEKDWLKVIEQAEPPPLEPSLFD